MQQVQCHEDEMKTYKQKNIIARFQDLEQCDESFYVTYVQKETFRKPFVEQTVRRGHRCCILREPIYDCEAIQTDRCKKQNLCSFACVCTVENAASSSYCKTSIAKKDHLETNPALKLSNPEYCRCDFSFVLL